MLDLKRVIASAPRKPENVALQPLWTVWGESVAAGEEAQSLHPHPQFERERFQLLDGWWDWRIVAASDAATTWRDAPLPDTWDGRIRVPFSPEAPLSGVGRQLQPGELLWYRRTFATPDEFCAPSADDARPPEHGGAAATDDSRCILHFEAVDYACACYCNGVRVGEHRGGYLPFSFDVTDALAPVDNVVALCVYDPSDEGVQLRGKQKLERGGIWYTAQSGIWQTVWLETVPKIHIASLEIDAQADAGRLDVAVRLHVPKDASPDAETSCEALVVRVLDGDEEVCRAVSTSSTAEQTVSLDVPHPHLWSPDDPHLYRLKLSCGRDEVSSYCAFRTASMERGEDGALRFCLNHEPCFLRGVLDQGYWPDGLLTAPSDEALAFDVQAMKDLGFNLLRKHIKIESDRWYYHCDKLGMLVWQDMVCGGDRLSPWHSSYKPTLSRWSWSHCRDDAPRSWRNLAAGSEAFRREWTETCIGTVAHLRNHPCIVTWVLFNEGWGQFNARKAAALLREIDPSRPIDAVSGWYDQACGDFLSVHNYFRPLEVYDDTARPKRAFVISEFGGLSCHLPEHSALASSYGYETLDDADALRAAVCAMLAQVDSLEEQGLSGYVYTQLSDVEEETNGILTYDRRINKLDGEETA